MTARAFLLAFVFTASTIAASAAACSGPWSQPPTNFELAAGADTIVLGTVESAEEDGGAMGILIVRPTLLIKGAALPARILVQGGLSQRRPAPRSDPLELSRPNPAAFWGSCSRHAFDLGMQLVLFLVRDSKGELQPFNPAFSRGAEDVPGPDALWVKAVRLYAQVSALPADRRRAALIARRGALLSSGRPDAALLAADIDRQLEEALERKRSLEEEPGIEAVPLFDGKPTRLPR